MTNAIAEEWAATIPGQFERIAKRFAARPALVEGRDYLTYAELDAASTRIAKALVDRIKDGDAPVAILLEHSMTQICAILGILKTGLPYCALDPRLPKVRMARMMNVLQSQFIVTDSAHKPLAEQLSSNSISVINLDAGDLPSAIMLPSLVSPDSGAAVFFTSGASGMPKCTARSHGEIVEMLHWRTLLEGYQSTDVVAMLYSCSFSASLIDLFGTLLHGATLCILDLARAGITGLAEWLQKKRVTRLKLNASILRQLLEDLNEDSFFPDLRYVRPTQQVYRKDLERLWKCMPPEGIIFHSLASSETNMVTLLKLQSRELPDGEVAPVGTPAPGVEIRIVDAFGQLLLPGEIGELIVNSPYMVSGYWCNPELTNEKFFIDPATNRRFYRLGDRARWRPDGMLELVGRKDFQVKIRGYRVEMAEVEHALEQLENVQRAVVVDENSFAEEKILIAYLVVDSNVVTAQEVRRSLRRMLPEYMIPSRIVLLDSLPTLPNGKVDRSALVPPGKERPELDSPYVDPRTPTETRVAAIWATVMGFDQVGVHDSFLDLGGHSLLAARIISRVVQEFQVDLPLRLLFDSPTVAEMALAITQHKAKQLDHETLEHLLAELEGPINSSQKDED